MYHATRDYGRKGSVMAAISAVDIALWDIAGKVYNRPITSCWEARFARVQPTRPASIGSLVREAAR
jgi:L-alanine-DL-glutamate epimerase-like enolase superfamily enzyme